MSDARTLARNVHRLRLERRLSLGELATRAGVAKQTLANLESGRGNPTIDTMLAVAQALGVGSRWLLTEWGSPVVVERSAGSAWVERDGIRRRWLDEIYGTGDVVAEVIELTDDQGPLPALSPGSLLHAYVLDGSVLAGTVDDHHVLAPGDFIRFPGDVTHLLNASVGQALVHLVTTIPRVQQFG